MCVCVWNKHKWEYCRTLDLVAIAKARERESEKTFRSMKSCWGIYIKDIYSVEQQKKQRNAFHALLLMATMQNAKRENTTLTSQYIRFDGGLFLNVFFMSNFN